LSREALWIAEAEVASMMDITEALRALEAGLLAEARGEARNMTKTHVAWEGGTLHAIGAVFVAAGFAGTKTWVHTGGGAVPLLVLYDARDGALLALVEAFVLGQLRTAAASGVATRWLAAEDASELAIIGTGKQALAQVAAVAAVRTLRRVRVFGRDGERREAFARRVGDELGLEATACATVAGAVEGAPIVTAITRATEPFLTAALLVRGAHVNAVGAITPSGAEVAGDVIARCGRVVVDSVPQAQKLSRELIGHFGPEGKAWARVRPLSEVVAAQEKRRPADDLTLFKSLGMGISDLSLGIEMYRRARQRGLGRPLPHPEHVAPRLCPAGPREEVASGQKRV
jgi:ornithine cyclodeaminase